MVEYLKRILFVITLGAVVVGFFHVSDVATTRTTEEKMRTHAYPKLANYYLETPIMRHHIPQLAKWDLLILSPQAQKNSHGAIRRIRAMNPNIVILVYVPSQEFPLTYYKDWEKRSPGVWHDLHAGITDDMWLRDSKGQPVTFWKKNWMLNIASNTTSTENWNEYLSDFVADELLSSGLWDGVFYDNVFSDISWINNGDIDADRDGSIDERSLLGRNWRKGMTELFWMTREKAGKDIIIVGNGDRGYYGSLDGHYFENFSDTSYMSWDDKIALYRESVTTSRQPNFSIVGNSTLNTGEHWDTRNVRHGLASALLFDGYYGFDFGDQGHSQLWWYPEYDMDLGAPLGAAYTVADANDRQIWKRDFERGTVILNPHDSPVHITTHDTKTAVFVKHAGVSVGAGEIVIAGRDAAFLSK